MSVRDRNMRLAQLRGAGVKVNDASTNKVVPFYPSSARDDAGTPLDGDAGASEA